jgi:hypothetical protein
MYSWRIPGLPGRTARNPPGILQELSRNSLSANWLNIPYKFLEDSWLNAIPAKLPGILRTDLDCPG